jgi:hypothetical protein
MKKLFSATINFESRMRLTPGSRKYFLDYDDHWSAIGHAKAAELSVEQLFQSSGDGTK